MIERLAARTLLLPALCCASLLLAPHAAPAQTLLEQLAENGAWKAYTYVEDGSTVCFMFTKPPKFTLTNPTKEEGNYTRRGEPNVMVTRRKASRTTEEVSVTSGYPYRKDKPVRVEIDGNAFEFDLIHEEHAWVSDAGADAKLVKAMIRGAKMTVRGVSQKGTYSFDSYSLMGFSKTRDAIVQTCP